MGQIPCFSECISSLNLQLDVFKIYDLRGSFAFVAQRRYPAKTVLVKVISEEQSHRAPARLIINITGISEQKNVYKAM